MEQLTVAEINTIIEALDAWTTSSKTSSLLGGLVFGAMMAGEQEGGAEKAKDFVKEMTQGEDEKQKQREEIAVMLKAKLIKMRDGIEVKDFAQSLK